MLVWCFIKYMPVLIKNVKVYRQVTKCAEEMGIDNAALFYSEEPLTSQAEQELLMRLKTKE